MGVYDLKLPLDFFDALTFAELCDLTERHAEAQEREEFFSAQICAHIRWAVGDKEAQIDHFMPSRVAKRAAIVQDQAAMETRFIAAMASVGITPDTE